MVPSYWFSTFAAVVSSALFLSAGVLVSPDPLAAAEAGEFKLRPTLSEPGLPAPDQGAAERMLRQRLDVADEIAALEALQLSLTEVADGSTYVWHRQNGRLSGLFQPTRSFRGPTGLVCRQFRVRLTSGLYTRETESTACRGQNGQWLLEG